MPSAFTVTLDECEDGELNVGYTVLETPPMTVVSSSGLEEFKDGACGVGSLTGVRGGGIAADDNAEVAVVSDTLGRIGLAEYLEKDCFWLLGIPVTVEGRIFSFSKLSSPSELLPRETSP